MTNTFHAGARTPGPGRMEHSWRSIGVAATACLQLSVGGLALAVEAPPSQVTFAELAPILQARCTICHTGATAPLGLRLDSLEGVLAGSQRGPVVKAGDPAGSELLLRLRGERQPRMPMTGPPFLSEPEIALFERWVAAGLMSAGMPIIPICRCPSSMRCSISRLPPMKLSLRRQ